MGIKRWPRAAPARSPPPSAPAVAGVMSIAYSRRVFRKYADADARRARHAGKTADRFVGVKGGHAADGGPRGAV